MKRLLSRLKVNNSGVMMSEIIIAFAVLMICSGTLAVCIRFTSNLMMMAKDKDVKNAEYQKALVEKMADDSVYDSSNGEITYIFQGHYKMKIKTGKITVDGEDIPVYSTAK
jgi:hypothetical protein